MKYNFFKLPIIVDPFSQVWTYLCVEMPLKGLTKNEMIDIHIKVTNKDIFTGK